MALFYAFKTGLDSLGQVGKMCCFISFLMRKEVFGQVGTTLL